jgi:CheY-like chemotaxis protein
MARILVVDDEGLVRHAVVRMLQAAGHEVREAPDGGSGLRLWRDGGADLVVTDIAMPDMTGFELIAALRAEAGAVPIIAMSGHVVVSDREVARRAELLGAVLLLAKPFSWDQLMAAVASALAPAA